MPNQSRHTDSSKFSFLPWDLTPAMKPGAHASPAARARRTCRRAVVVSPAAIGAAPPMLTAGGRAAGVVLAGACAAVIGRTSSSGLTGAVVVTLPGHVAVPAAGGVNIASR